MDNASYTLDCAFLHQSLVLKLLNEQAREILNLKLEGILQNYTDSLKDTFFNTLFTEALLKELQKGKIESLETLLLKNHTVNSGTVIWMEQDFYFKGTAKAWTNGNNGRTDCLAAFHTKLARYNNIEIKGEFNTEYLFGTSSVNRLSSKAGVFIVAYITSCDNEKIVLRPIFIGSKMIKQEKSFDQPTQYLELTIEDFDEFKLVKKGGFKNIDINILKKIPEDKIKRSIAEIIFEKSVPKDWGGEKSDLFTNHIHVKGHRKRAAFLFKGPAKFHPMTIADLGKNGDQISRLFDEPAQVFILQHCNNVRPEIYKNMKAFATQFPRMDQYCIIDAVDTIRLLKAYKKI